MNAVRPRLLSRSRPVLAALALLLAAAPALRGTAPAGAPVQILGLDVGKGNLTGGTAVTIAVTNVADAAGTVVRFGGQLAEVVEILPGEIRVLTPGVVEATGKPVDVSVRTADGAAVLPAAFTYTPTLSVTVIGSAATGGALSVDWVSEGLSDLATMTVWVGDPTLPELATPLAGYAGLLYEEPGLDFVIAAPADVHPILLHFPPMPAAVAGFPFGVQGLAGKEGAHKGSFTNPVTIVLP